MIAVRFAGIRYEAGLQGRLDLHCRPTYLLPQVTLREQSEEPTTGNYGGFFVDWNPQCMYDCTTFREIKMKLTEIYSTDIQDILLHEEVIDVFEMANLSPAETGIDGFVIWVNGGNDKLRHGPRIKVTRGLKWDSSNNSTIPLTGRPRIIGNVQLTQDEFAQIMEWINLNRDILLSYGRDELFTKQILELIQPIS